MSLSSISQFFKTIFTKLLILILTLILIVVGPVIFTLLIPIYIIRFIVSKIGWVLRADLGNMLTTRSSILAVDDFYSKPKISILVCNVVDGDLDIDSARAVILSRGVNQKNERGQLKWPELQQSIVKFMGFFWWKWDKCFNIKNHVNYYETDTEVNEDGMVDIYEKLMKQPFARERAFWEFLIVKNYKPKNSEESKNPKSVLIFRVSHCMADGYSIAKVLLNICETSPDDFPKPNFPKRDFFQNLTFVLSSIICAPYEVVSHLIYSFDVNDWHLPENKMTKEITGAVSKRISLEYLKDIKTFYKVDLNSVILAGMTGGIRNLMLRQGKKVPDLMHCSTALPMPNHPDKLRNFMTVAFVKLPVGLSSSLERLKTIHQHLDSLKKSTIPLIIFKSVPIVGGLFTWMLKPFFKNFLSTTYMTNMPGPTKQVFFDGKPIEAINFWSGLFPGNTSIVFTVVSYLGAVEFVVAADSAVLSSKKESKELIDLIIQEFDLLYKFHI